MKEPVQFDEAQNIADDLLLGKAVILNIESCDPEIAAKLVDFIGGVIYAIGGDIQKSPTIRLSPHLPISILLKILLGLRKVPMSARKFCMVK